MDESFCHGNHAIKRTWNEDGVVPNRPRGKGSLMIIVNAITKDGPLLPEGERYPVAEWTTGPAPTCEMIFRSKYATANKIKDYHDTMTGTFFMYWVENRLTPAFESRYPGKTMTLILDNAPYHHSLVDNGFRPDSLSKEQIVARLPTLKRKRRVPRLREIKIKPYADNPDPPTLPDSTTPGKWEDWVFLDDSGAVWLVDGVSDQGYGNAVVYSRVGKKKAGVVESTLVDVFVERLQHQDHRQKWFFLGYDQQCIRFLRSTSIIGAKNKLAAGHRTPQGVTRLRRRCREYVVRERNHVYTYPVAKLGLRYNGNGFVGTGAPKTCWLRFAVNEYIRKYYPELQDTLLRSYFRRKGWVLVFTVPYWASSQPIEQVWSYVKCYVALRWFPGRRMAQLRSRIICGLYELDRVGDISSCWKEPAGLAPHTGLTAELACKYINHSHKAINDFISKNKYIKHMGRVGEWLDSDIEELVLPTAGSMEQDEVDELVEEDTLVTESDIVNELDS